MPGVNTPPQPQPERLNVIQYTESQSRTGSDVDSRAVVQPSRLGGVDFHPRQTSSCRPQSGVNELTSFQDSCATAIDASIIGLLA